MQEFKLNNANGLRMIVSDYGGIVRELHAPDRNGEFADVVLGFDTMKEYGSDSPYFGALIGRYGNRIGKGTFSIDGTDYNLAINNGENHLHGGLVGFDKVLWDTQSIEGAGFTGIRMHRVSADGEEGYPGNLDVTITYKLTDDNEWIIDYEATTDKPTVVSLTQHTYFNLSGHASGSCLDHEAIINADHFTPVDESLIPIGTLELVEGTPFDFRERQPIGTRIDSGHDQMKRGGGYDHNFALNKSQSGALERAAFIIDPSSGRTLETLTTEPGAQFYSGNFLDGTAKGKGGAAYNRRSGFCVETQRFPDSPNQASFPSSRLNPGETYRSTTVYRFGVDS